MHKVYAAGVTEIDTLFLFSNYFLRDGITQEQAANRIKSQILVTNEKRVLKANVAICTLCEPEYTQHQVERANWEHLLERM